jgi:CheY-like chemotaxis protein
VKTERGLLYRCGSGLFALFAADLLPAVEVLRARGMVFAEYDRMDLCMPRMDGIEATKRISSPGGGEWAV